MFRRFRQADDGAVLIEFTLIVPILVVLLVGGFEFARIMTIHHAAEKTVRDVTRYLARSPGFGTNNAKATELLQIGVSDVSKNMLSLRPADVVTVATVIDQARYNTGYMHVRATVTFRLWLSTMVLPVETYTITVEHEQPCLDKAYDYTLKRCV